MTAEAYTVKEVAEILGCEVETATEKIVCGDLPGLKFGRSWIVPRNAFTVRLNEIALQEAQDRRMKRDATKASTKAIKSAQGAAVKPGRTARKPPELPSPPASA
ncbi:MAG: hypothetical protein JWQ72_3650 [Polaromonas sp.]|nr:hypothetical protein [Polaromonas sp.]